MCPKTPPPVRSPPSSLTPTTAGHITDPGTEQPLHRRLDGPVPGERAARQGADRAGDRPAEDHAQDPDAARRPRRAAARQAGGFPLGRSRDHENAQSPVHLERQPLLGVELQDAEVPAPVPRPVRLDRARAPALPRVLRLVQPGAPPLGHRPDDSGCRPPRPRSTAAHRPRRRPRRSLRTHARAVRPQTTGPAGTSNRRMDQQAEGGHTHSLNPNARRLTELDRLRTAGSED